MSILLPIFCGEVSYAFTDHENNPLTQHLREVMLYTES